MRVLADWGLQTTYLPCCCEMTWALLLFLRNEDRGFGSTVEMSSGAGWGFTEVANIMNGAACCGRSLKQLQSGTMICCKI